MRKLVLKESAALDEKQMNKVMGGDGGTAKNDSITNSSDANKAIRDGLLPSISPFTQYDRLLKMYEGIIYYSKKAMGYLFETYEKNEGETVDGGMLPECVITGQRTKTSK